MDIKTAVDEFMLASEADGLKPKTLRWYQSLLGELVKSPLPDMETVSTHDLREYIAGLRRRDERYTDAIQKPVQPGGLSDASIAGHVTALHAFFNWCANEYDLPRNPMQNIRRPRRPAPQPKAIEPANFIKIFEATSDNRVGYRDRAILCFLADSGCRMAGLLGLKKDKLLLGDRKAIVHEKGDVSRIVVYTHYTRQMLQKWLEFHQSPSPYVFISMEYDSKPLTESGLNQMLKRLKKRADVRGRVNPHSFRHNFAREYLRNGGDLVTLAKLLGHQDIKTTAEYYAIFAPDELADLHEKFSPLRDFVD